MLASVQVALLSDLREQALVQEEAVLHALVGRWRAALSWDDSAAALTVRPAQLTDTADGLRRLDRLQRHLQRLADDVLDRLVAPLLTGGRLEIRRDPDTVTLSVQEAEDEAQPPVVEPVSAVQEVYAALAELLTSLRDAALAGPLMAEFGALAGSPLAERLVTGPLAAAIPASLQQRDDFDRVIESTETFSAALAELGEMVNSPSGTVRALMTCSCIRSTVY